VRPIDAHSRTAYVIYAPAVPTLLRATDPSVGFLTSCAFITHRRQRDGPASVRQHEQGSRGTNSPAQRQHERDDAGRNAEDFSHKRRASSRGERNGAADDRWRPPEKRRDIDGDITRRDVQWDHPHDEDRGDRQRESRRRGDTRNSEQPSRPSSSSHLAPRHAPEGSRVRDMVDNVRKVSAN